MPVAKAKPRKPALKKAATPEKTRKSKSANRYNPIEPERIQQILKRLDERYPGATCALKHANVWELLVATILSAQSTDATVNKVTPELFRKYPTPAAMAATKPGPID